MAELQNPYRIVTVLGTSRPGNFTGMALALIDSALRESGAEVTSIDAASMHLGFPGQPATGDAERLRQAITDAAGVVLATPEYHGSFSAMMKLIIENLGFPSVLAGKPIALLGVAAGRIGAIKSLEQLRSVCSHIGAVVLPSVVSIANVQQVFDEHGQCSDPATEKLIRGVAKHLIDYIRDHVCPRYALEAIVRGASPESVEC